MKTSLSIPLAVLSAAMLAACGTRPVATVTTTPATVAVAPAAVAPAVVVPSVAAPTAVVGAPAAPVRLAASDIQFISVAAGAGMYEVEAARMALTKAADPQVRSYAQMLVDHHTANNNELTSLVRSKGHRIAPGLPQVLQDKVAQLSRLSGEGFDREFVRTTGVEDHRAAIAAFEQGRPNVADRDLQAYIDKTLPTLRSHLQQAQDLAGRMAG